MQAPSARSRPDCALRRSPAQTTSRLCASLPVHQLVRVQTLEMSMLLAPLGRVPCHPRLRPLLDPPTRLWQTRVSISAWVHRRSHLSPMHDTCPSVTQTLTPHTRAPGTCVALRPYCQRSSATAPGCGRLAWLYPLGSPGKLSVPPVVTFTTSNRASRCARSAGRIPLRGLCPLRSSTCSASQHFAIL